MSAFMAEYRRQVVNSLITKTGTDPIAHCALGLTAEAGEVADLVKKSQYASRDGIDRDKMKEELGDTLWYLTFLADQFGWSVEGLARSNVAKLEIRHPANYNLGRLLDADLRDRVVT